MSFLTQWRDPQSGKNYHSGDAIASKWFWETEAWPVSKISRLSVQVASLETNQ